MADTARIDKWLWAARIFKTRSIAADACKNSRVTIGGQNVKPSHTVKVGEVVSVKKPPIVYSFKILKTIEQRVGAKLIPEIYGEGHEFFANHNSQFSILNSQLNLLLLFIAARIQLRVLRNLDATCAADRQHQRHILVAHTVRRSDAGGEA